MSFEFPKIIGIDFDNTLIDYSNIMYQYAVDMGYLNSLTSKDKNEIRNKIRLLDDGEKKWQQLQAVIYGIQINKAERFQGVLYFFQRCLQHNISIKIISHKTKFAAMDETKTDLRQVALKWMDQNSFFRFINKQNVFFEPTLREKIKRIISLDCNVFIDDLDIIFNEKTFPAHVRKILFCQNKKIYQNLEIEFAHSWKEIFSLIFN